MQVNNLKELMMEVGDARVIGNRLEFIFPDKTKATLEDFNKKYNMLTPIGVAGAFIEQVTIRHIAFICECDCGNKIVVPLKRLKGDNIKSCGCQAAIVRGENGKKNRKYQGTINLKERIAFRKNLAKELGLNVRSQSFISYLVKNDLSNMIIEYPKRIYKSYNPKIDKVKKEKVRYIRSDEEVLYNRYQKNSIRRGLEFTLDLETYIEAINKPCVYCGEKDKKYSGLDRINNKIGYTKENIAPCCEMCNFLKGKLSVEDFINQCKAIAETANLNSINKQIQ
jgi:hypothetical protein